MEEKNGRKKWFKIIPLIKHFQFASLIVCLFMLSTIQLSAESYVKLNKSNITQQQQRTISGIVTDSNGDPLPGVTVVIKGTSRGTITDIDGRFSLTNVAENEILQYSFVGMETIELRVANQANFNQVMSEISIGLEEVIAIGYGTQRRENVIGSVTAISAEDLSLAPVSQVSNALAGRLPGGIFMQTTGEPGNDASRIRIRGNTSLGNNEPLIVVDGIPGRDLNSINSNDIESISVLKDASAAIYGARAANGVILVNTKSGKTDAPATFTYNFYQGALTPTKLPKMADAATYATMVREMQSYRDVDESNMMFSQEDIAKYASGEYPWTHPNTDWFAETLKDYSTTSHHNMSVTGGTKNVSYYGSFGTQFDDGIYKNSGTSYNRYNLKLSLDAKINEYVSFGLNITGSQEKRRYPTKSQKDIFKGIIRMYPTSHAFFPGTDLPGPDIEYGDQPVVSSTMETGFDDDRRYRSNNILSATLKNPWIEGLSLSSYFAYDKYIQHRKFFEKPWTLYSLDEPAYFAAGNTGKEDGTEFLRSKTIGLPEPRLTNTSAESTSQTFNIKLDYTNTFNDVHNVEAFVAYEQNQYDNGGFNAFRRFFISDQLPYLFAGGDAQKNNNEWVGLDARQNYFGRVSYNYNNIYHFQFSLRRDGSLRFSKESGRWGNFPSMLVGYRPSQHEWWDSKFDAINDLKFRLSWGQLGNDQVAAFQYLTSYAFSTGYVFGQNKDYITSLVQSNTPNPNITWEVANILNFGWDSKFFNNKLNWETDFFYEKRKDILVKRNVSVPSFTGMDLPDENFGIVDNRGFETLLSYQDRKGDFNYKVSGNFAFARNKIVEADEPEAPVPWQVKTGSPMNPYLMYKSLGIYRDWDHVKSTPHLPQARPGDIIIEDYDGDGEITAADRQLFPLTDIPEITYGMTFDLSYKNWHLSVLIQGQARTLREIYSSTHENDEHIVGTGGNYLQWNADDRWTEENINATKPRAFERTEEYWKYRYITDFNYTDNSFARLKNLQLSYSIPEQIYNQIGLKAANVFVSGQNLFMIYSANKIWDPETDRLVTYPVMRVFSVGAKITF